MPSRAITFWKWMPLAPLPPTSLRWRTRSSIKAADITATSTASPPSMRVFTAVGGANTGASFCPLARSKAPASPLMTAFRPPELITLISSLAMIPLRQLWLRFRPEAQNVPVRIFHRKLVGPAEILRRAADVRALGRELGEECIRVLDADPQPCARPALFAFTQHDRLAVA